MLKYLSPDEVSLCVEGGLEFYEEAKLPGGFKPDVFISKWRNLIETGRGAIIGMFDGPLITGALGAVLCPDLNNGDLMAVECFWFVHKRHRGQGIRLLLEFEKWAKSKDVLRVAMIHLTTTGNDDSLRSLYDRLGYKPIEVHFVKSL